MKLDGLQVIQLWRQGGDPQGQLTAAYNSVLADQERKFDLRVPCQTLGRAPKLWEMTGDYAIGHG